MFEELSKEEKQLVSGWFAKHEKKTVAAKYVALSPVTTGANKQPIVSGELTPTGELSWTTKVMDLWQQFMFRPIVGGRPRKEIMTVTDEKLGSNGELKWTEPKNGA